VAFPEFWLFFLGALFIAVTLFLPDGIVGLLKRKKKERHDPRPDGSRRAPGRSRRRRPAGGAGRPRRATAASPIGEPTSATAWRCTSTSITVSFDGFKALNNLSLTIDVGELRCIIGPNGAGKTTMMDCITGKTRPDSGKASSAAPSTCCA
jgi:ABC-type glutathione transport system ATPase component